MRPLSPFLDRIWTTRATRGHAVADTESLMDGNDMGARRYRRVTIRRGYDFGVAFAALLLAACDQQGQAPVQPAVTKAEVAAISDSLSDAQEKIRAIQNDLFVTKYRQERFDAVVMDPAEGKGYERIETTSGSFLISLQESTPHLDGVRVKLHIGNIQFATYNGFELKVEYSRRIGGFEKGRTLEEIKKINSEFVASKRTKTEKFTQPLRPGTWSVVYMNLPDIKPENFGRLEVSMSTDNVGLNVSR